MLGAKFLRELSRTLRLIRPAVILMPRTTRTGTW